MLILIFTLEHKTNYEWNYNELFLHNNTYINTNIIYMYLELILDFFFKSNYQHLQTCRVYNINNKTTFNKLIEIYIIIIVIHIDIILYRNKNRNNINNSDKLWSDYIVSFCNNI